MRDHDPDIEHLRRKLRSAASNIAAPDDLVTRARERERKHRHRRRVQVATVVSVVAAVVAILVVVSASRQGQPVLPAEPTIPVHPAPAPEFTTSGLPWRPVNAPGAATAPEKTSATWLSCAPTTGTTTWKQVGQGGWGQDGCDGSYYASRYQRGGSGPVTWLFPVGELRLPAQCDVRVHLPATPRAVGRVGVFVDSHPSNQDTAFGKPLVQKDFQGTWVQVTNRAVLAPAGSTGVEVKVELFADEDPQDVAAGAAQVRCTSQ